MRVVDVCLAILDTDTGGLSGDELLLNIFKDGAAETGWQSAGVCRKDNCGYGRNMRSADASTDLNVVILLW